MRYFKILPACLSVEVSSNKEICEATDAFFDLSVYRS